MLACLAGAAWVWWRLLLLSLVVAPLAGLAIRWLSKMLKRANRRAMEQMAQLYNVLEETFRGIKIVKAFTNEPPGAQAVPPPQQGILQEVDEDRPLRFAVAPHHRVHGHPDDLPGACWPGRGWCSRARRTCWASACPTRPMDLRSLLLFYGFLFGTADPVRKFSDIFSRLQCGVAAADRIYALLDREPAVRNPAPPGRCPRHHRESGRSRASASHYQPGPAGAGRDRPADPLRRDGGDRGPQRLRQDRRWPT